MTNCTFDLIPKKTIKVLLTKDQKTFNLLRRKIKLLQKKQEKRTQQLDASLQFYYGKIQPIEDSLLIALANRAKAAYNFYKTSKSFSKRELNFLKKLIIEDVNYISEMSDFSDISADIKEIFRELNGFDYEEAASVKLEEEKKKMEEMFKSEGINIDLSAINLNNSKEEIIENIIRSVGQAASDQFDSPRETLKTKKEQEKELKKREFEAFHKKSLNSIYKQLAKALHPDLEQDSGQKIWKEKLMKRLITAYENNDLHDLLALEMEWLNHSTGQVQIQSTDQLKIYNAILKDQEKTIKLNIDMLILHAKYLPIRQYYDGHFDAGMLLLKMKYNSLLDEMRELQTFVLSLQTPKAEDIIKAAIKDRFAMN